MSSTPPLSRAPSVGGVRAASTTNPWPKAPVLGWADFKPRRDPPLGCVGDLPHRAYTTSGRAALLAALRQIGAPAGISVLVPTYHCPTMVAPVVQAGLRPRFYAIGDDGLPLLDALGMAEVADVRVMIVAHFFGLAKGLQATRRWCTERGVLLIEDCAHAYFGRAGDRAVGEWGDFATASLSKFFPVPEGGLLASATRPLNDLQLVRPSLRAEVKSLIDIVELAQRYGRLTGLAQMTAPLMWAKNRLKAAPAGRDADTGTAPGATDGNVAAMLQSCDMSRADNRASMATRSLHALLPASRLALRRRANYQALVAGLAGASAARPLKAQLQASAVPYVCPLWVDDATRADAVYAAVRSAGLPVFRWDRIWPGTPRSSDDAGSRWQRQVLQLLCHQSLSSVDIADICVALHRILRAH